MMEHSCARRDSLVTPFDETQISLSLGNKYPCAYLVPGFKILSFVQTGVPVQVRPGAPLRIKSTTYKSKHLEKHSKTHGTRRSMITYRGKSTDASLTPFSHINFQLKNTSPKAGGLMEFVQVKIRKFSTLIKRSDIKTPNWFAVEHNILLHPDFFGISGDEFKVYIWIIGTAAHLNSDEIRVYSEVCASQLRIKQSLVHSSIEKLKGKRWDVTDPLRVRTGNFEVTNPTVQGSTGENSEVQDSGGNILALAPGPEQLPKLIAIWNELCGELPKVRTITDGRRAAIASEWPKLPEDDWRLVVAKIAESDFCNGQTKSGDWKAGFDWMLEQKKPKGKKHPDPHNYLKVLEGNYDNRETKTKAESLFKNPENAKWAGTIVGQK
jgi:hypothetical protein